MKANSILRTQLKDILARGEEANEARSARVEEESKLYEQYRARSQEQETQIKFMAQQYSKQLVAAQGKIQTLQAELLGAKTQMTHSALLIASRPTKKPFIGTPTAAAFSTLSVARVAPAAN